MLDAALNYAADGWHVFPLQAGGKTPATAHGLHDATTDAEIITRWWTATPDANIGCACGPSGLFVIDIDVKDNANGYKAWFELCDKYGDKVEPVTRQHTTPSGGEHRLYLDLVQRAPDAKRLKNTASKLAPLIDTRGDGGYIVMPPSVIDGVPYTVDVDIDPHPVPPWIIDLLKPRPVVFNWGGLSQRSRPQSKNYATVALTAEAGAVVLAPEGQRNDTLVRSSFNLGQLVGAGKLDYHEVEGALTVAALRAGLTEHETAATIASGITAGMQNPRRP